MIKFATPQINCIQMSQSIIYTVRQSLRHLNLIEILLLTSIIILAIISFVREGEFGMNNVISVVSAITGVFCVVLGAKGSIANWVFGVVECFLYTYIAISGHIYGDALQRILYTLPMQFVGWSVWRKRELKDDSTQIKSRYMTWRVRGVYTIITTILVLLFGYFLIFIGPHLNDVFRYMNIDVLSNYSSPMQLWLDSMTTVISIVAIYMSAKAYVEQWYMWLLINVFSIMIWLASPTEFSFMVVAKYSVYLVNSFYGIYMWHKLSKMNIEV